MEVTYILPYPPTPWTAPRRAGKIFYSPHDKQKKRDIASIIAQGVVQLVGPIRLDVVFYMPIPASFSKKKKAELEKERTYHVYKPDRDNCAKHLSDILEKAGVYQNDSQIVSGFALKLYGKPRTVVHLVQLDSSTIAEIPRDYL